MSAEAVARGLDHRARREGRNWRTLCPVHDGRSLCLADGRDGHLLVKCWAGCDPLDVLAELRRRGLLDERNPDQAAASPEHRENDTERNTKCTAWALDIWREARPAPNTPVVQYLKSRGIDPGALPAGALASLRFHPRCRRPKDEDGADARPLPAMVALVQHVRHGPAAVSCAYLRADGSANADLPKDKRRAFFGPVSGGAVRFGEPRPDEWLALAEGVETTLSVAVSCRLSGWAALSAGGLRSMVLPAVARLVLICADHDRNGVGQRAASEAAQQFLAEGRRVKLALPPQAGTDFNDMLTGKTKRGA
jgi:putative DNA primase/helicase